MLYDKVSANLNFIRAGKGCWRSSGRTTQIFEKSIDSRQKRAGHIHFMTARRQPTENPISAMWKHAPIKDMIPRYRAMKGCMVPRKAGWDTHGLPVELEVEKLLGLDGKEQIEEYGLEPFIREV